MILTKCLQIKNVFWQWNYLNHVSQAYTYPFFIVFY